MKEKLRVYIKSSDKSPDEVLPWSRHSDEMLSRAKFASDSLRFFPHGNHFLPRDTMLAQYMLWACANISLEITNHPKTGEVRVT